MFFGTLYLSNSPQAKMLRVFSWIGLVIVIGITVVLLIEI